MSTIRTGFGIAAALVMLATAVTPARAESQPEQSDGWNKVFEYAGCAIAIISVPETGGISAAVAGLACAHVFLDEVMS